MIKPSLISHAFIGLAASYLTASAAHSQNAPNSTPFPVQEIIAGTYSETPNDHAVGMISAPATMIIYASVTCPHCASWFNEQWPVLKHNYVNTGKLRFIFREFPTSPAALSAANFAIAACGPKAQYMDNIEYQMATQAQMFERLQAKGANQNAAVQDIFKERAARLGITGDAEIEACLKDSKAYSKIQQSVEQAQAANINSVPAILLNGQLLPAKAGSAAALSTAIDAIIARN